MCDKTKIFNETPEYIVHKCKCGTETYEFKPSEKAKKIAKNNIERYWTDHEQGLREMLTPRGV